MSDKVFDAEQLYNDKHREGWGDGKSWENLGDLGRSVMGEVAKQETIRHRLESLTSLEFDREAEESHAEMVRIWGAFEQPESEGRQLDKDLTAAKQKHEADSERMTAEIRVLNREFSAAERKDKVVKMMVKEQK